MKFEICHVTRYLYDRQVGHSVNEIRLTPRTNYRQSCYHHTISIEPNASLYAYEDYFGNRVHAFSVNETHSELAIQTLSTVVTHNNDYKQGNILPRKAEGEMLGSASFRNRFAEFLLPTGFTEHPPEVARFADDSPGGDQPVYETVTDIAARIHRNFVYEPNATHVHTTVEEFFRLTRGVCQDFAHLMIAVCRYKGIPARYVSGYQYVGDLQGGNADFRQASHAWVEAYIPGTGWIGFDPTNNMQINWRYVKLGHGRDYNDIVPVKGVYVGEPGQTLDVTVDVRLVS